MKCTSGAACCSICCPQGRYTCVSVRRFIQALRCRDLHMCRRPGIVCLIEPEWLTVYSCCRQHKSSRQMGCSLNHPSTSPVAALPALAHAIQKHPDSCIDAGTVTSANFAKPNLWQHKLQRYAPCKFCQQVQPLSVQTCPTCGCVACIDAGRVPPSLLGSRHFQQFLPAVLPSGEEGIHDGLLCSCSLKSAQSTRGFAILFLLRGIVGWSLVANELQDILQIEVLQHQTWLHNG